MNWVPCPICNTQNPPDAIRCRKCAADFGDPDVMALMGADAPKLIAPELADGALAHGSILGFRREKLENGQGLKPLVIIGGLLITGGFLMPVKINFQQSLQAWEALEFAAAIPLLFPAVAVLMGVLALAVPLATWQRSTLLLAAGCIGIATLPFLGSFSAAPSKFTPVLSLGIVLATWGILWRCLNSTSQHARILLAVGAGLAIVGYFLPMDEARNALPAELRFYLSKGAPLADSASPFTVYKTVFNKDPMVFFSSVYLLAPLVLLPIAGAIAWRRGGGAWDKSGMMLRPMAWFFVYYLPIGFALFAFNLVDNSDTYRRVVVNDVYMTWETFSEAGLSGRFRLLLLSAGFSLWATLPFVGLTPLWPGKKAETGAAETQEEAAGEATSS